MPERGVPKADEGRIGVMDGVRACSILLVLAGHLLPLGPKFLQLNQFATLGGMALFFTLSGFLITRLLCADNNFTDFLIRRLSRIVPLVYLYIVIVFVVFNHSVGALLNELLFTLNYNTSIINAYNGHLWSLCVEIQFYLVIGALFRLFGRGAKWFILGLCLLSTALHIVGHDPYTMMTHLRGDEILTGSLMCLSVNGEFGDHRRFWRVLERATPALAVLFLAVCDPLGGFLNNFRGYAASLLVASLLSTRRRWLASALTSRPMVYIANISYALYIIHPAAAAGPLSGGPKWLLYLVKRPITLAITFGLAHLSTFYYERRWIDFGRRIVQARRAARIPDIRWAVAAAPGRVRAGAAS
jgi:peptidoglycan/LPS O-acetylase OafA/YrhL